MLQRSRAGFGQRYATDSGKPEPVVPFFEFSCPGLGIAWGFEPNIHVFRFAAQSMVNYAVAFAPMQKGDKCQDNDYEEDNAFMARENREHRLARERSALAR